MAGKKRSLRVFLCHSSKDNLVVENLYQRLIEDEIDAWIDKEKLIPGQNWEIEISKAVTKSDVVIICLSSHSVTKEGFVNKEIKFALDTADQKPEGTIFIIPARLDKCKIPERMRNLQGVDLFSKNGYEFLLKALRVRANNLHLISKQTKTVRKISTGNINFEILESIRNKIQPLTSYSDSEVATIANQIVDSIYHEKLEAIYRQHFNEVRLNSALGYILQQAGKVYAEIEIINQDHNLKSAKFDNDRVYYIAEWIKKNVQNRDMDKTSQQQLAASIADQILDYLAGRDVNPNKIKENLFVP